MKSEQSSIDPFETHFTTQELAEMWKVDDTTIRRMFQDEDDVFRIPRPRKRGCRDYVTIRIPESVARRKYRECSKKFG